MYIKSIYIYIYIYIYNSLLYKIQIKAEYRLAKLHTLAIDCALSNTFCGLCAAVYSAIVTTVMLRMLSECAYACTYHHHHHHLLLFIDALSPSHCSGHCDPFNEQYVTIHCESKKLATCRRNFIKCWLIFSIC